MRALRAVRIDATKDEGLRTLVAFIDAHLRDHPDKREIVAKQTFSFMLYDSTKDEPERVTVAEGDQMYFFSSKGGATDANRFMVNHADHSLIITRDQGLVRRMKYPIGKLSNASVHKYGQPR